MRDLLFLAHRIPYPPTKGDKIRAWHFLKHFCATRRVYLGCFVDDQHDWSHVPIVKEITHETCIVPLSRARAVRRSVPAMLTGRPLTEPYYDNAQLANWVHRLRRERPMTVFVYSSSMAQYVMDDARMPRVIDFVDVDSEKWREYSLRRTWPVAALYRREARALLETERRIAAAFDASIFVSEAEANLFKSLAPESAAKISAVSIGVDCRYVSPDCEYPDPYTGAGHSALCFTGMMDYWPNVDAVTWFVHNVFARVRRTRPSATFWIVGANPTPQVRRLARQPGVVVTGRVRDTRPYLAHAATIVAPLRVARGIQNKVLEAMAMGRPVVASAQAFEGIHAVPDRDLIVARTADEFAIAVDRLWQDGVAQTIGTHARRAVQTTYDWPRQISVLDRLLASVEGEATPDARIPTRSSVVVC